MSQKKTSFKRHVPARTTSVKAKSKVSVSVQTTSSDSTQPAGERKAAIAELNRLVETFAPTHQRLISSLRRSLRKRMPTVCELVYEYRDCFVISYSPNDHGYEGILGLRGSESGVRLYFNRGKELPDPSKLLKGSGTMARSIDVDSASMLARPDIASLIDASLALNKIPFARTGRGSVIVRSTKASSANRK